MRTGFHLTPILLLMWMNCLFLHAQPGNSYTVNGSAVKESCNCFLLTPDKNSQSGSVWNTHPIDLSRSFDYVFNINLGCKDETGGGGIIFVLQALGTGLLANGQGGGLEQITPSVIIPIDTRSNPEFNDPSFDFIGIYKNGDTRYGNSNTLAGPVQALVDTINIEDCNWHTLRIIWNSGAQILSAELDQTLRVKTNTNLVQDVFGGNSLVYWGFLGSTQDENNVQQFCTALNPAILAPAGVQSCNHIPMLFDDHSVSFGTIVNWSWDFGDGTTFNGEHPPAHVYQNPGFYTIKMNIQDDEGCISDTLYRSFIVGSRPVAGFKTSPSSPCANAAVAFLDSSSNTFGKINSWKWEIDDGEAPITSSSPDFSKIFPEGIFNVSLTVQSEEGCVSDPYTKTLEITSKPSVRMDVPVAACYGDPVLMVSENLTPAIPIAQWVWFTGDGNSESNSNLTYYYSKGGVYPVTRYALNNSGCSSDTISTIVTIYQTNAKTGNDTVVVAGIPFQLHGSGGEFYEWSPIDGLSDPDIADPVSTIHNDQVYTLEAFTSLGCPTYDTIRLKSLKGPAIYVPNAFTPDNNGLNDRFRPILVGIQSIDYFEIFNRAGQEIYSIRGEGPGWDGRFHNQPQPAGVYVWAIRGRDYLGNLHSEKGTVLLIR